MDSHRFGDQGPLIQMGQDGVAWTSHDGQTWWPADYARFRPMFAEAMDGRFYTIEFLDALILTSKAQVWFGDNAAIVTELRTYPTGLRAIHGLVAAGDLEEIRDVLIPRAEAWARDHAGCRVAMIESREGWARALKDSGYEVHQTVIAKDL